MQFRVVSSNLKGKKYGYKGPLSNKLSEKCQNLFLHLASRTSFMTCEECEHIRKSRHFFKYQFFIKSASWLLYDLGKLLKIISITLWNNNFTRFKTNKILKAFLFPSPLLFYNTNITLWIHKNPTEISLLHVKYRMDIYTSSSLKNYFVLHIGKYRIENTSPNKLLLEVKLETASSCTEYILKK